MVYFVVIFPQEDELGVSSIKVFGLEQLDGGGAPRLLRQLKLPPAAADGGTSVTCLAVHENLFMAAGFGDGRVILWRGEPRSALSGERRSECRAAVFYWGLKTSVSCFAKYLLRCLRLSGSVSTPFYITYFSCHLHLVV